MTPDFVRQMLYQLSTSVGTPLLLVNLATLLVEHLTYKVRGREFESRLSGLLSHTFTFHIEKCKLLPLISV